MSLFGEPAARECSRAGCGAEAAWRIDWKNPRIHTGERGKTWLACDEHKDYLHGFLAARGFPVTVTPLGRNPEQRRESQPPAHSAG